MEAAHEDFIRTLQVMVVDDDQTFRRYLQLQLEMLGCQIVSMASGDAAWERIQAQPPDLVLSDVLMPGMSGVELCRRIKSTPQLEKIPVVLLTLAGSKAKDAGYQAGADDFLTKPPHLMELKTRLRNLLLLSGLQATRGAEPAGLELRETATHAPRILVLESFGILRDHVKSLLTQEGLEAQGVGTVSRFMECLEAETPDLVIIDQNLMEGPGSALVSRLRSKVSTSGLTILLMCDPDALELGTGAWHSEADEHLVKPFEASELRARVKSLLKHSELRHRKDAQHLEADPMALKDPRSGTYTRAFLYACLDPLCAFAVLARQPIGLMAYQLPEASTGRPGEGRRVAGVLMSQLKPHEILCRLGEDLFVAVMPGAGVSDLAARVKLLSTRLYSGRFATAAGLGETPPTLLKRIWEQLPGKALASPKS
jgi:two-component system cell cycle response regulator